MNTINERIELHSTQVENRSETLRSELEETRAAFHHLLKTIGKSRWNEKSPSSAWTIGQVLVHLTWALEYLPEEVRKARQKKGMFNLPKRMSDTFSFWYIRWITRNATPASIARRYDRAMDASIALLEIIPEADWQLGANFYGEGFHSVEDLFHVPARHLAEHTAGL
jgi:hypothetical protein